ncbi:hypothetical protein Ae201684P_009269 [Aphanomyces euteiches]|uniref:Uncharacterized protein n=1 Tax=Aphanomyces euteiches TaxID=100861 RepID=A0A6G0WN27_9STRA|nr:hypothetical protein Ae201684_013477 [Aphanomyces euteiches]KAH9063004.1 hypothetical protein Ae201684P_009269 [Aphanomyces euteiches]
MPDVDYTTCPILAIALALASQVAPSSLMFPQLPAQQANVVPITPATPLIDVLDDPTSMATIAPDNNEGLDSGRGVHNYVNRLLDRVALPAGVSEKLTSHSFRRGGVQHANSSSDLTAQWIFDRGAWNMSTTSKAFAYVFNTPSEDCKVAKVLNGWQTDERVKLMSLNCFDSQTQQEIRHVMARLFFACFELQSVQQTVSTTVLETLMAYLLRHFPRLWQLNENSFIVRRLEGSAGAVGVSTAELLA